MPDLPPVAQRYESALREFVGSRSEAALQRAYELGREAIAAGWGVLDLLHIHQEASASLMKETEGAASGRLTDLVRAGAAFLSEALAPFEMTHRGFQEAYATLRQSEARYRSLVENAPYGICRCALNGQFVSTNPALVKMLRYESEQELMAADPAKIAHCESDPSAYRRQLREFLQPDGPRVVEVEWCRKDGSLIHVRLSGRAVTGAAGAVEGVELIAEDTTEQRALEERLQQAQKLEAVGRLAGGIAHDFNNFITGITLCNHILGRGLAADDPRRRQVEEIDLAATRAALLTQQLLAFARRQVLQPRVLDLNEVIGSMTALLRPLLGADVDLVTRLAAEACTVHADPGQLEQMVMNLAVNARDAMPEGGTLTVRTRVLEADPGNVRPAGRWVSLAVTDTGVGMDAATQARVFEPFFTTKEPGRGTGLGLSTVYGIATQSGGRVRLESSPGAGSTFTIDLPYVPPSGATPPTPTDAPAARPRGAGTILVAEDDDVVRRGIQQTLEAAGYATLVAPSAEEALVLAKQHAGQDIRLLITDLVMRGMGGRALAEHFRVLQPRAPVLYISGYLGDAAQRRGLSVPEGLLLQKPFSADKLTGRVAELMRPAQDGGEA